jgi:hypothetical protein
MEIGAYPVIGNNFAHLHAKAPRERRWQNGNKLFILIFYRNQEQLSPVLPPTDLTAFRKFPLCIAEILFGGNDWL